MARIDKFSKRPPPRGRSPRRKSLQNYRYLAFQLLCILAIAVAVYTYPSSNGGANDGGGSGNSESPSGDSGMPADNKPASFAADSRDGFNCRSVRIIDGDTFDCGTTRIRLQGIDAPEKDGQCRPGRVCTPGDPVASTRSLAALTQSAKVRCTRTDTDHYGRTVARCSAGGVDLSCEQIRRGHAVKRYAPIQC